MVCAPTRKTGIFKMWVKDNGLESGGKLKLITVLLWLRPLMGFFPGALVKGQSCTSQQLDWLFLRYQDFL